MKILRNQQLNKGTVLTIGNFDGMHKGHLKLINKVTMLSKKYGYPALVCTFDRNTKSLNNLLFPQKQLEPILSTMHIDYFCKLEFKDQLKSMSPETFVVEYLVKKFQCKIIVIGENFFFGENKSGTIELLQYYGRKYDFKIEVVKFARYHKEPISSSKIRNLIEDGKVERANKLSYTNFSINGTVENGFHVGNAILNTPTANIKIPKSCVKMKHGVYKTEIEIDNRSYKSITNVGYAPTKQKKKPSIETFIFDFNENIYHKRIKVTFLKYIRNERKFKNFAALKKQIEKDIKKCNS